MSAGTDGVEWAEAVQLCVLLALALGTLTPRMLQPLAGAVLCLGIVAFAVPPLQLGLLLLAWLEGRYSIAQIDRVESPEGIIIAGGGLASHVVDAARGVPLDEAGRSGRIAGAVALARRFPEAKVVYAGREELSARVVLTRAGIAAERIIIEDRSSSTYENALNTTRLLQPRREQRWILVTSAVHMPRALATFRDAGFDVIGYPVDFLVGKDGRSRSDAGPDGGAAVAVRELTAIIGYVLTGRIRPWRLIG